MSRTRMTCQLIAVCFCIIGMGAAIQPDAALNPTQSIVDFLKAKGQDSSLKSRTALFESEFGKEQAYKGTKDQNALLLRRLLAKEPASCCGLSNCVLAKKDMTLALVGGFGWGSRAQSPPEIWAFKPGESCKLEDGVFGLLATTIPGSVNKPGTANEEAAAVASKIASRVKTDGKHGPVVLMGHSWGAAVVFRVARELGGQDIPVDLLVAIDAIDPSSPVRGGNELEIPSNVINFVHIAASDAHWALTVPKMKGAAFEYMIEGTTHTDVDNADETHSIVRHLISLLPELGANAKDKDYFVPKFPVAMSGFPAAEREMWKRSVKVSKFPQ